MQKTTSSPSHNQFYSKQEKEPRLNLDSKLSLHGVLIRGRETSGLKQVNLSYAIPPLPHPPPPTRAHSRAVIQVHMPEIT